MALKDRIALMKKLDINNDGEISEVELCKALSTVGDKITKQAIDNAMKKFAAGSLEYKSMKEYVAVLMKRFDGNGDGLIQFPELTDGLKKMGMPLTIRERQGLMKRLDINNDGGISAEELLKVLNTVDPTMSKKQVQVSVN